jgi:hypothetical protein
MECRWLLEPARRVVAAEPPAADAPPTPTGRVALQAEGICLHRGAGADWPRFVRVRIERSDMGRCGRPGSSTSARDLAGLAVNSSGTQIGATADDRVRSSGDPLGVGVTIDFVLPNSLYGVPISIAEISSTFDGLRCPTRCPSTPENFTVSVDSYSDPTVHVATAPLSVTGCSSLSYSPAFALTATRDSGDSQVAITTQVTQAAGEAPSRSLSLVPHPSCGAHGHTSGRQ